MSEATFSDEEIELHVRHYQKDNELEIKMLRLFLEMWVYLSNKGVFDIDEFMKMKDDHVSQIDQRMEKIVREKVVEAMSEADPRTVKANSFLLKVLGEKFL